MWRTRDLIIVLIVGLSLLATLEWVARKTLLEQLPNPYGPRAQAIHNNPSPQKLKTYPIIDPILGWKSKSKTDQEQNVTILKSPLPNPKKILILGGSTSDLHYYKNAWPKHLHSRMNDRGQAIEVHVGAVAGYNSHQELLKTIRDARLVNYDLIISYTGVNEAVDRHNPHPFTPLHTQYFVHRGLAPSKLFYGLSRALQKWTTPAGVSFGPQDELSIEERFLLNIKSAQAVSNVYGARYMAILQPYLSSGERELASDEEELLKDPIIQDLIQTNRPFYTGLKKQVEQLDFFYDGTGFLDGAKNVYHDDCHVTQEGNKIVAKHIAELIQQNALLQ